MPNNLLGVTASAASSGTCGENLTWVLDDDGTFTVSGTGDMYDYTKSYNSGIVSVPWWYWKNSIENIVIEGGVTSVGDYAFYDCESLKVVRIPDSMTSVGSFAFCGCTALTAVHITDISKWCAVDFSGVYSNPTVHAKNLYLNGELVTELVVPDGVTSIGKYAFSDCSKITEITIPDSVTSIEHFAFSECTALTAVHTTDISKWCAIDFNAYSSNPLYYAKNLYLNGELVTELVVPDGVTSIGDYAFENCSVASITISKSVRSIGENAFCGCSSLTTVNYYATNCTHMGSSSYPVFRDCSALTTINIGETVETIPDYAFYGCSKITEITIPDSVTSVGDYAFHECTALTAVNITDLSKWCAINFGENSSNPLYYAKNLYLNGELVTGQLVIPDGVTSIGSYVFSDYSKNTGVDIPDSVESIGNGAFRNCTSLTNANITNIAKWCAINFGNYYSNPLYYAKKLYLNDNLVEELMIPEGVTKISSFAFYNCISIKSLFNPDTVTNIGESAFYSCTNLTKVNIKNVSNWCAIEFGNATSNPLCYAKNLYLRNVLVTNLEIPDTVPSISDYAFYNCTSITKANINNNVNNIGNYSFYNCTSLSDVTIPNSVTEIGQQAFEKCANLRTVTLGNGITSIGSNAFKGCTVLKDIYITDISNWCNIGFADAYSNPLSAFSNTYYSKNTLHLNGTPVAQLIIPNEVTQISDYAFYNNGTLTNVTIPNSVTSIGENAFYKCTSLATVNYNAGKCTNYGSENHNVFAECTGLKTVKIVLL